MGETLFERWVFGGILIAGDWVGGGGDRGGSESLSREMVVVEDLDWDGMVVVSSVLFCVVEAFVV